jgi:tight adherence protein C
VTPAVWGAVLGGLGAAGLLLVATRALALRRTPISVRVLPYVRDLPQVERLGSRVASSTPAAVGVFGPVLRSAADTVERVLGGSASVRRRLQRAGIDRTVHEFRVEQVQWGLAGFAVAAAYALVKALTDPGGVVLALVLCGLGLVAGVLGRDTYLSSQVRTRERQILAEFPTVAELLALAVAAGEGPVAALDRVVRRSGGELSAELGTVLAAIRTGEPVATAFDRLSATTGVPLVARFAQGVSVAVERGTPLADVLHAQAADVREAGRRELIEVAARKEVLMMIPVVFLILPVTVLFTFYHLKGSFRRQAVERRSRWFPGLSRPSAGTGDGSLILWPSTLGGLTIPRSGSGWRSTPVRTPGWTCSRPRTRAPGLTISPPWSGRVMSSSTTPLLLRREAASSDGRLHSKTHRPFLATRGKHAGLPGVSAECQLQARGGGFL